MKIKYEDTKIFLDYLNHKHFWVAVFRPDVNGEYQKGGPLENNFYKTKKATLEIIKKYDGRGLVCLAINERQNKDQSIQSIDRLHSLIIDIDVQKKFKEGFVSLPVHHEKAQDQAQEIKKYLEKKGFLVSLVIDSGNGSHIYIYLDEAFNEEYLIKREKLIKEYKKNLHIKSYKDDFNKQIRKLWESQEIYKKITSFENDLKLNFKSDILAVDNITKDINRRMKVPGVLNTKDIKQSENRRANIIYYNKDFIKTSNSNINTLNKYEYEEIKDIKQSESVDVQIVSNDRLEIINKLNYILKSKKTDKNRKLIETFDGSNLVDMFGGDRSAAEQSLVNQLVFKGFKTFDAISLVMSKSNIGKWQESQDQYKSKTFEKALELYKTQIQKRENKKNNIINYFEKYKIFLLSDSAKTKYIIYHHSTKVHFIKDGDENLSNWLHIKSLNSGINLEDLNLFYPASKKNISNLLLDFLKDHNMVEIINDINFKPTNEIIFNEEFKQYFNTYIPNEYLMLEKSKKEIDFKTDCKHIYFLFSNICGNDEQGIEYLLNILSFMLKNPHIKTGKLIVFFGEEAAGKGIFYSTILKKLFSRYAKTITGRDLDSSYNGYLSETIALYINEVSNKRENENTLKNWITEEEVSINNKYGSNKIEKTYFTIFADVNGNNPIQAGERRGVYFKSKTLGGSLDNANKIGAKLAESIPSELNNFAQYLINKEVSFIDISKGYESQAKKDILNSSKTIEDNFLDDLFSFESFENLIGDLNRQEYKFKKIKLEHWLKEGFIEVNLLLDIYNNFRVRQNYKPITIHKFHWIYDKLNINRNNTEEFKRVNNSSYKRVFWINCETISKHFKKTKEVLINV